MYQSVESEQHPISGRRSVALDIMPELLHAEECKRMWSAHHRVGPKGIKFSDRLQRRRTQLRVKSLPQPESRACLKRLSSRNRSPRTAAKPPALTQNPSLKASHVFKTHQKRRRERHRWHLPTPEPRITYPTDARREGHPPEPDVHMWHTPGVYSKADHHYSLKSLAGNT